MDAVPARARLLAAAVLVTAVIGAGCAPATPTAGGSSAPAGAVSSGPAATASAGFSAGPAAEPAATWTGLHWRRLQPPDPLSSLRQVIPVSWGWAALGAPAAGTQRSLLWISSDGSQWAAMPSTRAVTVALSSRAGQLVALEAPHEAAECSQAGDTLQPLSAEVWSRPNRSPVVSDTILSVACEHPSVVTADGPAGLLVATTAAPISSAISADAVHWRVLPADAWPAGFVLVGLWARGGRYLAIGSSEAPSRPFVLQSSDGEHWTPVDGQPLLTSSDRDASWSPSDLVIGRDGAIAIGHTGGTPGTEVWWRSLDGIDWRRIDGYPPLGVRQGPGEGIGGGADGWLASDGSRVVALRLGSGLAAWTSFDGVSWSLLDLNGEFPSPDADRMTVLPNGVLLQEGIGNETASWFGEAITPVDPTGASEVLRSYLEALRAGDCAAARAFVAPTFHTGNGELCGATRVTDFTIDEPPAGSVDAGEVVFGTTLTTTGSADGSVPPGTITWFYALSRSSDGIWRITGGGSGP